MKLDEIQVKARHLKSNELADVLLIDLVNRVVDVLPEANLEGGSQESWSFDDIHLFIKL